MDTIHVRDSKTLRPLDVVLICLIAATVAGGSLLLSAAESLASVDGAIDWHIGSPLRALVQLLCLNYRFPTINAGEVKVFILAVGTGLALATWGIAILLKPKTAESDPITVDGHELFDAVVAGPSRRSSPTAHIAPWVAAQVMVGFLLLWSFASSRWSAAPTFAIGGSILLTIHFLWSFVIGHGLCPGAARTVSRMLVAIAGVTAVVAIWYYYGRNPTLRAKFPYGNPNFMSASLIPGILLGVAVVCERVTRVDKRRGGRWIALTVVTLCVLALSVWAFYLTGSRGPALGLVIGGMALAFFMLRGRARSIPLLAAMSLLFFAWLYYSSIQHAASPTGRGMTIRFRLYAWSYAWRMFKEKPFTGHGQGSFVLTGDSHVVNDILDDPLVFQARIAHAHNEWLEVLSDLGTVGLVLLFAAVSLTLRAGMLTLNARPPPAERWLLAGLMGALVGLIMEESVGVGLRVSGVSTVFYTVLGLIWALSSAGSRSYPSRITGARGRRALGGVLALALGVAVVAVARQDFAAARDGFRVRESLERGAFADAIAFATRSRGRLSPQRRLTNLYRLAEAHMLVARKLQQRASVREERARDQGVGGARLLALAAQDRERSDAHCQQGSKALKELVERSPAYLNHGRVEYLLNLVHADNAGARNDLEQRDYFLQNARAAIERELLRQPFDPTLALDCVSVAGSALDFAQKIDILARPLRHHRLSASYVDLLTHVAADAGFEKQFESILRDARSAVILPVPAWQEHRKAETWGPEKLRLAATIRFRRGDYRSAREMLGLAARAYDLLVESAPLGAASCYAELGDSQFFENPGSPAPALESAARAVSSAPDSLAGRRLKLNVKQRMVDYYLAQGNEASARQLLIESSPTALQAEVVDLGLSAHYRRLCESLLRRRVARVLRQSPSALLPKLRRWVRRAIELDPSNPLTHYIAADLAFHAGNCDETETHLKDALDRGLDMQHAWRFLEVALDKQPECEALAKLLETLERHEAVVPRDPSVRPGVPTTTGPSPPDSPQPEHSPLPHDR